MPNKIDSSATQARYDYADILIAVVTGLMFVHVTLFLCTLPLAEKMAGGSDFVAYWATGQQLAHHANPYDQNAMIRIEHGAGLPDAYQVGFMRNPPWGLLLALPLGYVGLRVGALLWSLFLLACHLSSVRALWRLHGKPNNCIHWIAASFAPALICLMIGQTSVIVLLGFTLFLRMHRSRPFLAGLSLWLCTLKPHLFLPIGAVLLAWILVSRSYKLLAGAIVALAASCAAVTCLDPAAWFDYAQMMRTTGIENEQIPCLSVMLRLWLSPHAMWLSYLPTALACLWALGYFWPRRNAWNWNRDGGLVLLLSLLTAPYAWICDGAVAIPALLQGAYLTRSRILLAVLALASLLIEVELLLSIKLSSTAYLWTAPAWLAWYLLATRASTTQSTDSRGNGVQTADLL